jgi:hypothetical protein
MEGGCGWKIKIRGWRGKGFFHGILRRADGLPQPFFNFVMLAASNIGIAIPKPEPGTISSGNYAVLRFTGW